MQDIIELPKSYKWFLIVPFFLHPTFTKQNQEPNSLSALLKEKTNWQ